MPRKSMQFVVTDPNQAKNLKRLLRYFPENKLQELWRLVSLGTPINLASRQVGIASRVTAKLLEDVSEFREFLKEAETMAVSRIEQTVYEQAVNGHFASQALILQNTTDKYAPPAVKIQADINSTQTRTEFRGLKIVIQDETKRKKKKKSKKKRIIDAEVVVKRELPDAPTEF